MRTPDTKCLMRRESTRGERPPKSGLIGWEERR